MRQIIGAYSSSQPRETSYAGCVADREEGRRGFFFNNLDGLTHSGAVIEIQRDFPHLANGQRRRSDTKNPAGVAARGGVQKGLVQLSRPTGSYRAASSIATSEAGR